MKYDIKDINFIQSERNSIIVFKPTEERLRDEIILKEVNQIRKLADDYLELKISIGRFRNLNDDHPTILNLLTCLLIRYCISNSIITLNPQPFSINQFTMKFGCVAKPVSNCSSNFGITEDSR